MSNNKKHKKHRLTLLRTDWEVVVIALRNYRGPYIPDSRKQSYISEIIRRKFNI